MFIGEFRHNLDQKGRVAVPSKFRINLKDGAVVTRGLDECLFLYPKKEWQKIAEKLANLPVNRANNRAFSRLILAGAMEVNIDKQGRIILPDYLRSYGGIKKKVVIAGLYNRAEIWDEEKWEKFKTATEKSSTDIAEAMGELGV